MYLGKTIRIAAVASGISLAGCAPVTFAPGTGLGITLGPSLDLGLASCTGFGGASLASRLGLTSAGARFGEARQVAAEIQSRSMLSADAVRRDPASWKRAATGECR